MIRVRHLLVLALIVVGCTTSDNSADTTSVDRASSTTTTAVPTSQPITTTTVPGLAPVAFFEPWGVASLEIGELGWEDAFIGPGALIWADGEYHLFYVAVGNELVGSTVGHASTSRLEDGFFRRADEPLFTVADADYLDFGPSARSVVIADDRTWMLFFSTAGLNGRGSSGLIGRATAPGPDGPWRVDPEPVLLPGEDGAWDDLSVRDPYVIALDGGYRMYYSGDSGDADARPDRQIGMATSADGIIWEKHDDPSTGGLYEGSDPVFGLGPENAWDGLRVFEPVVIPVEDGYVMFYASTRHYEDERLRTFMYGYAVSADGVDWDRPFADPLFTSGDNNAIFGGRVVRSGDDWYLVYGAQAALGRPSQVELAIWRGELPTD